MSTEVLSVSPHNSPWHSWREIKRPKICGNLAHDVWEPATPVKTQCPPFFGPFDGSTVEITRRKDTLHDWEIRLVDRLDRKLGWMYNETTPGQKPYHFALLANHWLNRETWLVIDPVSRVPIHHRRQWGDPRFNVPYPEPGHNSRPKYPAAIRKRAQIPRIDAWRAAVNNQRRASGIRDVLRTVELYEDSAEEPPDGKIDPACWILPKPPQGFSMSTSQRNAWYEGGAGWQETLDNWQQVRRGYRLRKIIHEGRANRNRVKEIATQINRGSRITSLKLLPREREQTVHSSQAVPQ
ncbi:hypothetical protein N7462_007520 [Penicillium macrosclerotiorum]|uniref:uncharacterized protein n=1 Tax=Penicillium macrosclerotiorum TaxID=303699 RepID=UPI00254861AD|nr:uncharacterized protein N7462_007520 [Penicillium macrosclerotiorum]KAJ5679276.1 hypothetical protein N7462_007520 [Penicillium macrosclerotiorum]